MFNIEKHVWLECILHALFVFIFKRLYLEALCTASMRASTLTIYLGSLFMSYLERIFNASR